MIAPVALATASPAPQATASPAPQATASPAPPSYGVVGNLGGVRSRLSDRGLDFFGRYVGEFAANTSGGFQRGSAYSSEVQLGFTLDTNRLENIRRGGIVKFIFTERWGSGLSPNALGNIGSVQEIYGDALTPRLTELDYDQRLSAGTDLKFGRVIMQNDFAASATYWGNNLWCFYQSNAICGTPVAAPNNSGYGYYPSSEWGGRLKTKPTATTYLEGGAYQVVPLYAQRGQGFNLTADGSTGFIFPFETGVTLTNAAREQVGTVRLGAYYETSSVAGWQSDIGPYTNASVPAAVLPAVQTYRGRSGGWFAFDHLIAGRSLANERGTAFWLAYEYGDPQTSLISNFGDVGIVQHGTFSGRPNDSIALGFDEIDLNARLRNALLRLQNGGFPVAVAGQERAFELNYGIAVSPSILLRPSLQYVLDPNGIVPSTRLGGAPVAGNAVVFGLTTSLSF